MRCHSYKIVSKTPSIDSRSWLVTCRKAFRINLECVLVLIPILRIVHLKLVRMYVNLYSTEYRRSSVVGLISLLGLVWNLAFACASFTVWYPCSIHVVSSPVVEWRRWLRQSWRWASMLFSSRWSKHVDPWGKRHPSVIICRNIFMSCT